MSEQTGASREPWGEYVDTWWQAIDDFTALLERLTREQWSAPTDLPGWDVHAVAAHTAHLEALRAGTAHDDVAVGEPAHVRSEMGVFTEQGVVARAESTPDDLINEIRSSATAVHTELLDGPDLDPAAPAPGVFGAIGWSNALLLRNRPLDVWMHEQDIRRAVGDPGGLDSDAARHTAAYLAESLPMVVGKRAQAPAGTTVVLDVAGQQPQAVRVGDDGRAAFLEVPEDPTVRIGLDREQFILAAGGRRPAGDVRIEGDEALGRRIVESLAVTP